jgi:hypothetical protein
MPSRPLSEDKRDATLRLIENNSAPDHAALVEIHQRRRRLQLARLLQITEQMLAHAQVGEWEELDRLEDVRHAELVECFEMQHEQPSLLIAEALGMLLSLNDQIVALVQDARQQVAAAHNREFGQKTKASMYTVLQ